MSDIGDEHPAAGTLAAQDGFSFHGKWQELLPIVATNLILTIVTLGIYRFWAKARVRRYLWSRTQFIDDRLEWTGTGKEMFIGFLIVIGSLVAIGFAIVAIIAMLTKTSFAWISILLGLATYIGIFWLMGVAVFRALRYRLSRTRWHGIRGGSDNGGWDYGSQTIITWLAVIVTLGLLTPWSQVTLWRARWGSMSFGDAAIGTGYGPIPKGIFARYLLIYVVPFLALAGFGIAFASMLSDTARAEPGQLPGIGPILMGLAFYAVLGLMATAYFAKFYRSIVGEMDWMGLDFSFTARTKDWVLLYLGHIGLIIVTLGFGLMFIGYRNWKFFVQHMHVDGALDTDRLKQSQTTQVTDAEGLADAFDIGAI